MTPRISNRIHHTLDDPSKVHAKALLRYTPPPEELHLHLIDDVEPPAEFSGRNLPGGESEPATAPTDVEMHNGTRASSNQSEESSDSSNPLGETLKVIKAATPPQAEGKIILKVIAV